MTESSGAGLTEVLYGIVIANAIYELTLEVNFRNATLLLALGILIADWVEYHLSVQGIEMSDLRYAVMLVLDVTLLLVWYLLTTVPEGEFPVFILLTVVFFGLVGVWSGLVMGVSPRKLVLDRDWGADWQISVILLLLYGARTRIAIPREVLLAAIAFIWIARKTPVWYRLMRTKEANI